MNTKSTLAAIALAFFVLPVLCGFAAEKVRLRGKGVVDSVERGMIQATFKEHGKVSIPITDKTDIHVRGDFGLDKVQPGMYLSFSGVVKGAEVEGEIVEASMFSLADGFKPGIVKISDDAPQSILGQVTKVDGQKVTLNAGRKVTATFSEKIKITLDTIDYSIAAPGHAVDVNGTLTGKELKSSRVIILVGPQGGNTATKNVLK